MPNLSFVIALTAIVGTFAIPLLGIVMYFWCEVRKSAHEAALKQDMVARGYSAKEIVHVMTNGKGKSSSDPTLDLPPAKPGQVPA